VGPHIVPKIVLTVHNNFVCLFFSNAIFAVVSSVSSRHMQLVPMDAAVTPPLAR